MGLFIITMSDFQRELTRQCLISWAVLEFADIAENFDSEAHMDMLERLSDCCAKFIALGFRDNLVFEVAMSMLRILRDCSPEE